MPQTLAAIRQLLESRGLTPKHQWGQHFLHDHNHMQRIVDAADLHADDRVLEVGAGTGALTERLLEARARVVAVEIDQSLAPILHERLDPFADQVTLIIGDVLIHKRAIAPAVLEALRAMATPSEPASSFKLIANLPYNVASPLLSTLALDHPEMTQGVVMVQREVADRLTAAPGNKQYGPLGILVQAMCDVKRLATLPPTCFWPRPKVGSALVQLTRRPTPLTDDPQALTSLVHTLFTKRRKQLGSILGRDLDWPETISPDKRPEALSVEQLITLAQHIPSRP